MELDVPIMTGHSLANVVELHVMRLADYIFMSILLFDNVPTDDATVFTRG